MKIYCKKCKKETEHTDYGSDIRPDRRYNCKECKSSNQKD
jgi:ribosomal protein L44E